MKHFFLILAVFLFSTAWAPTMAQKASRIDYRLVASYPHSTEAFTQGLEIHNGTLYESTGLHGQTSVRKVDLQSGAVVQIHNLPSAYFGEGITILNGKLYQLTWQSYTGFIYDAATLTLMDQFNYSWEGWGLTHANNQLIISDGTDVIHFVDPDTYEEVRQIAVRDGDKPVSHLNELEYVNDRIFANVWPTDSIAVIDPQTGSVLSWLDLSGLYPKEKRFNDDVLNGIAYSPERGTFLVTGKLWDTLFEIRLVE